MTDSKPKPNRLREYREAAGLTQQELADAAGAGRVTIVRVEQGNQAPSLDLADRLADELDTTIDELFSSADRAGYDEGLQDGRRAAGEDQRVAHDTQPGEDPHGIAAFVAEVVQAKPSAADRWQVWHLPNPRGTQRKLDAIVAVQVLRRGPREAKRLFDRIREEWCSGDDTQREREEL
jgi:putative transcriptional regulator